MKKSFSNRIVTIESLVIFLASVSYYIFSIQDKNISLNFLVNFVFLVLIILSSIFRSGSIRHMFFAFIFLILSVVGNIFGFSNFLSLTSSLTLSLFILGILNMLLFGYKN